MTKHVDEMNARELVALLRELLLTGETMDLVGGYYRDWTDVMRAIEALLERDDIWLWHIAALGMTYDATPVDNDAPANAISSFCKSIYHESLARPE